ncbi:MAG TPA: hypothetical protein DCE52_14605 [Rhodobacteraceae bacterium]|nr:hypothetical protein [Paracoccaceae bacterium]
MKTQVWFAVCTDIFIVILKKRFEPPRRLKKVLKIMRLTVFETTLKNRLLMPPSADSDRSFALQQRTLLGKLLGQY